MHPQKLKQNKKIQKAFTLIELLIVIAIIGLLASVVLVALARSREKANISAAIQNSQQMQKALELYYSSNNSYPLPNTECYFDEGSPMPACWQALTTALQPYGGIPQTVNGQYIASLEYYGPGVTHQTFAHPTGGTGCVGPGTYGVRIPVWFQNPNEFTPTKGQQGMPFTSSYNLFGGNGRLGKLITGNCVIQ